MPAILHEGLLDRHLHGAGTHHIGLTEDVAIRLLRADLIIQLTTGQLPPWIAFHCTHWILVGESNEGCENLHEAAEGEMLVTLAAESRCRGPADSRFGRTCRKMIS